MYREIYEKINNFLTPSKSKMIFYSIFSKLYKKQIEQFIEQLEELLLRAKHTNNYDECLDNLVYLLINEKEIEKCIYSLYQSVLYYQSIKDVNKEFKTLNKILEICQNNINLPNINTIVVNCHKDIAYILEENFELDEAVEHLHIAKSLIKKYEINKSVELIEYQIACIYITRNQFVVAAEYLYGIIFYKEDSIVYYKENQIIMMYILTLLVKKDRIIDIRNRLKLITQKYLGFYETDEYVLIINIISCVENRDNEHFIHETHRFVQKYKEDIFRYLFLTIKRNIEFI